MKPWPKVSLGELLRLERRPVKVEPEKLYQEIGIYCFGRGIFHKTPCTGFEVGNKDLFLMMLGKARSASCRQRKTACMVRRATRHFAWMKVAACRFS
jgi:hypothetical protein